MPLRCYARDALVQHCLEVAHENADEAERILDHVVRSGSDFLVPYACAGPRNNTLPLWRFITTRFNARRWVQSHIQSRNTPSGLRDASYLTLLSRAYLITQNLSIPDDRWSSLEFVDAFHQECSRLVKISPRRNNFTLVRENAYSGPIIRAIEEQYPSASERYQRLYDAFIRTIHCGLPPDAVVEHFLGVGVSDVYANARESLELLPHMDIDIDIAMRVGLERQMRHADLWSRRETQRAVDLLQLYLDGRLRGLSNMSIGEEYERYRNRETQLANQRDIAQIEMAHALQCWRIRVSDRMQWRDVLSVEQWRAYEQCERAMKALPGGVYSRIPRRHFNQSSVQHMPDNLDALCRQLFVTHPVNDDEKRVTSDAPSSSVESLPS
jgi:hypothetical protein